MLRIKPGVVLTPYGRLAPIDEKTDISQEALEHLQTRYPNDIEGKPTKSKATADSDKGQGEPKELTNDELQALLAKYKSGGASEDEKEVIAKARLAGKI